VLTAALIKRAAYAIYWCIKLD